MLTNLLRVLRIQLMTCERKIVGLCVDMRVDMRLAA